MKYPLTITGLDLETTGLKVEKSDRIIEVGFKVYHLFSDGKLVPLATYNWRVNPQRTISEKAQAVHGITLEDLRDMPIWSEIAEDVKTVLECTDVLIIHNAEFDKPFLWTEQTNAGHPVTKDILTFCTMANGRWATFDGKVPSLHELAWTLGVEYDTSKAHGAEYDISVMMECFSKGLSLGLFKLPIEEIEYE